MKRQIPDGKKIVAAGFVLGLLFWPLDCLVDALFFSEASFLQQLVSPEPIAIWFRGLVFSMFTGFGLATNSVVSRMRRAEAGLNRSEERLQLALEGAKEGLWDWHIQREEVYFSPQWEIMLGYAPGELEASPRTWERLVHPDDRERAARALTEHLKGLTPHYELDHRMRTKTGDWIWVQLHGKVVERDAEGKAVRAAGTQVDITARKRIEEELKEHRERLEELAEQRTEELQATNESLYLEIAQRTKAEEALWNMVRGTSATTGRELFQSMVRHIASALRVRYAYVCQTDDPDKGQIRTLASWAGSDYAEDIEYAAKGTPCEEVLQGNVCYYPVGVQDLFPEDRALVDLEAESYLGVPIKDATDKVLGNLVVMDDKPMDNYLHNMSILSVFASRAGAEMGRARAEEKQQETERLAQDAQKLESLGVLAGGIAHDFNNLLVGVVTNAHMVLEDLSPDAPITECVQEIAAAGKRAAELCQQLLAYSGKGKFLIQPVDLNDTIREMAQLIDAAISKKTTLRYNLQEDLSPIEADATQMRQIVMNLITNASEAYNGESGEIWLSTGELYCDKAFIEETGLGRELVEGDYVYLEVDDSGSGMDEDTRARIFEPFYTTKFTGRGLGLSSVLGAVHSHRGAMRVLSKPGRGTTFTLFFPRGKLEAGKIDAGLPAQEAWRGKGTVLLVDDDQIVRSAAGRLLERAGFTPLYADNGRRGVETFRERAQDVACVILDLTMAEMDGEEAFKAIRGIRGDVPIILSSGYAEPESMERFANENLSGFVQKPYEPEAFIRVLRKALDARVVGP